MSTTVSVEFEPFPKLARLHRDCIITEKLDGTNAQIYIGEDGTFLTGSRNRWIKPGDDNYGFAAWAYANKEELMKLGPGRHFGEWWGAGIQRRYNLTEKRFSLFNTSRWLTNPDKPSCVHVVPVLYHGMFTDTAVEGVLEHLKNTGSLAAPGFMEPEGVVVYHVASKQLFKKTLDNDAIPKSLIGVNNA